MTSWLLRGLILLLLLSLVGCTALPFVQGSPTRVGTPSTAQAVTSIASATPGVVEATATFIPSLTSSPPPEGGVLIRVWLPPEFDPGADNPASKLLRDHLEAFSSSNPDVRVEVRVKAIDGVGGLLDSLVSASAAAPLALPDVILLPRGLLESAVLKGLLYPSDDFSALLENPDWFEYAYQLARVQSRVYGVPFAGDALVLAYHLSQVPTPPVNLDDLIGLGKVLLFPVTDQQALFTLSLYLAEGKTLQDEQGRPWLDESTLIKIYEYDQRASAAGVMPYWLTQYGSDAQVWETFAADPAKLAATWASILLRRILIAPDDLAMAPLPTMNAKSYSLATGWSWALAGQDARRRAISAKLVEYMVEKDFLAQWSQAAGYMPPRIDALQAWQQADLRQVIEKISYSASLVPPADMISSLGAPLEQGLVDIIKSQIDPQSAARTVVKQVNQP